MKCEIVETIPNAVYEQASGFKDSTVYHTWEWHELLRRSYGWQVHAVIGYDRGQPVCVLPFVRKRRLGLSKCCVALPLSHHVPFAYDGGLMNGPPLPDEWKHLFPAGVEIHDAPRSPADRAVYSFDSTIIDLSGFSIEDNIRKSFAENFVRNITKATKNHVTVQGDGDSQCLSDFLGLMTVTRHRQGSPVYPSQFFHQMQRLFSPAGAFKLYVAYHENKPVSGAVFLYSRNTALYGYSASVNDMSKKRFGANELVMWTAIREAFARGATAIDLGISSVSQPGLRAYKEKWGGLSRPLLYCQVGGSGQATAIGRDSCAANLVKATLRRTPVSLFRRFSPWLLRVVA